MNLPPWIDMVATDAAAALLNGLWPGLVLAALVWGINRYLTHMNRLNATTRFAVCATALLICFGFIAGQGLRVSSENATSTAVATTLDRSPAFESEPVSVPAVSAEVPEATSEELIETTSSGEDQGSRQMQDQPLEYAATVWGGDSEPSEAVSDVGTLIPSVGVRHYTLPGSARTWFYGLLACWMFVSCILLLRVLFGVAAVCRLKRFSVPLPDQYQDRVNLWLRRLAHPRPVRIAGSQTLETPVAVGFVRPMILIPVSMLDALNEEETEHVLLHELAHLQRWDDWTILIQRIFSALLFFHPGILWLCREMNREREFACDDWVVALTGRPKVYATCLAKMVAIHVNPRQLVAAPGLAAGKKRLFERVSAIMDRNRVVSFRMSAPIYGSVIAVLLILVAGLISLTPVVALSAFEEPPVVVMHSTPDSPIDAPVEIATEPERASIPPQTEKLESVLPMDADHKPGEERAVDPLPLQSGPTDVASPVLTIRALPVSTPVRASEHISHPSQQVAPISKQSLIRILKAAQGISSNGDKASFLTGAMDRLIEDDDVYIAYIETAATIRSSGDRARVLSALLNAHRLGTAAALTLLDATARITSSSDKARVLRLAATSLPRNDEVEDAFLKTAETIRSSSDYRRVLSAYLNGEQESTEQ